MGNKRISELQIEVNPKISDLVALASDGQSKRTTLGSILNSDLTTTFGDTIINGDLTVNGTETIVSSSVLYDSGSTIFGDSVDDEHDFIGDVRITGSLFVSGGTELGGNIFPKTPQGSTLGTIDKPFRELFLQSGSISIESDTPGDPSAVLSNNNGNLDISVGGMRLIESGNSFIAETGSFEYLSGSFNHIGSAFRQGNTIVTGSFAVSGSTVQIGDNTLDGLTKLSGSVDIIGNTTIEGTTTFSNSSTTVTGSFLVSGSTTQIGNNTLDGDTMLSGSVDISGSTEFNGDVDVIGDFYHLGNKQYNYGQFHSLETQSGSADTPYEMKFEGTDSTNGISIGDNGSGLPTRITPNHTGLYNIQFSIQLGNTANSDVTFDIWFRQNGTNVPNSNTKFSLLKSLGSGLYAVAALNFMTNITAGDYVEIMWSTDLATGQFEYLGTQTSPTRPATPSIILTVTQIA